MNGSKIIPTYLPLNFVKKQNVYRVKYTPISNKMVKIAGNSNIVTLEEKL